MFQAEAVGALDSSLNAVSQDLARIDGLRPPSLATLAKAQRDNRKTLVRDGVTNAHIVKAQAASRRA
jgi:hypothetical protein